MKKYRKFWSSIPQASDIKVINPNGTVDYIQVDGKKDAAKAIRDGRRKP